MPSRHPSTRLLAWFARHARDLPFRRPAADPSLRRDPYHVWVSEVMLQQTQVATVVDYFRRFVARFPTVEDLARSCIDDVLHAWQGLGYYRRARHLHDAARVIVDEFGGHLPADLTSLRRLPGVGPYMAGAIASLAFNNAGCAIDGNVLRVAARVMASAAAIGSRELARVAEDWVLEWQPVDRAGDFNEALFELGATVCLPRSPQCARCPIAVACQARRRREVTQLPVPRARKVRPVVALDVFIIDDANGLRLWARRAATAGLLGGLWELPMCEPKSAAAHALREATGLYRSKRGATFNHELTHRQLVITVRTGTTSAGAPRLGAADPWDTFSWLPLAENPPGGITNISKKALSTL